MEHYKFIIACAVLIISFFSKLGIGKDYDKIDWIKAFIELPVNLFFLSLSLLCAYTITSNDATKNLGLVYTIIYFLISFVVILIWRFIEKKSVVEIDNVIQKVNGKEKRNWHWTWICFWGINYLISASTLYASASLLFSRDDKPPIKKEQIEAPKKDTLSKQTKCK
ncbi:MAG TPA: hypothetical protein VN704_00055 [Verrucomicrobiae bacterium]|nr:hypothetical protein [Verrucomicrobiae bacterium]